MIVPSSEHNGGEVKYRQAGIDRVILSISADYSVACNSTLYDVFYVPQLPVFSGNMMIQFGHICCWGRNKRNQSCA